MFLKSSPLTLLTWLSSREEPCVQSWVCEVAPPHLPHTLFKNCISVSLQSIAFHGVLSGLCSCILFCLLPTILNLSSALSLMILMFFDSVLALFGFCVLSCPSKPVCPCLTCNVLRMMRLDNLCYHCLLMI